MNLIEQQTIALSAVVQTASIISDIAVTGNYNDSDVLILLQSILVDTPKSVLDVYGGDLKNIKPALRTLVKYLNSPEDKLIILKYVAEIMKRAYLICNDDEILDNIGKKLKRFSYEQDITTINEDAVLILADIYTKEITQKVEVIKIVGEKRFLMDSKNVALIRALILAGIRNSILWKQSGGSRWSLFFSRGKFAKAAHKLLS